MSIGGSYRSRTDVLRFCGPHPYRSGKEPLVDLWGIEPQPSDCKTDVLPLSLQAQNNWRMGQDSNPRSITPNQFSRLAPYHSATHPFGGNGGIRTLGGACAPRRFSKPEPLTAQPRFPVYLH